MKNLILEIVVRIYLNLILTEVKTNCFSIFMESSIINCVWVNIILRNLWSFVFQIDEMSI